LPEITTPRGVAAVGLADAILPVGSKIGVLQAFSPPRAVSVSVWLADRRNLNRRGMFGVGDDLVELGLELADALPAGIRVRDARSFIACGGDPPLLAVPPDELVLGKARQHLLACAAVDVGREPFDAPIGVVEGVGEDGVLGRGQWGCGHGSLLQGW